jgi:uncharacterized membrane protein YgdD (TMEM256/DUF423 family)
VKRDPLMVLAALSAALAIGAGAFGAHVARPPAVEWLKTGALYQMIHAVGTMVVGGIHRRAAWLMLAGAGVFSLSLYAMALGAPRWFGAITPVGGLAMIAAWLWLTFSQAR